MAVQRSARSVDVPIKVVAGTARPAPSPVAKPAAQPTVPKLAARLRPSAPKLTDTPEHLRRRIMWISVAAIMVVLTVAFVPLLRSEFSHRPGLALGSAWSKIKQAFSGLTFKQPNADAAAEKEIRSLDTQVFPELSN